MFCDCCLSSSYFSVFKILFIWLHQVLLWHEGKSVEACGIYFPD